MKKQALWKFLFAIAGLLLVGFCIRLGADYLQYSVTLNSAPFSVFVLVRALEFLLPAVIALIAGLIVKKKASK